MRLLARGLGWGSALGAAAGFVGMPLGIALYNLDPLGIVVLPLIGSYAAVIGAGYGAVAGLVVALAAAPFASRPEVLRRLRPLWALLAAGTVAAISTLVFRPELSPGANETMAHVREDLVTFYVLPCLCAAAAAALATPKLLPAPDE